MYTVLCLTSISTSNTGLNLKTSFSIIAQAMTTDLEGKDSEFETFIL